MDLKLFWATFLTLFVAELGDKTQLACIMIAADSKKPWTVFAGSALALTLVSLLGVIFAQFICQYIPSEWIKKTAAGGFIILGVLIFFNKI